MLMFLIASIIIGCSGYIAIAPSRTRGWAMYGSKGVNDYFASFTNNNDDDNTQDKSNTKESKKRSMRKYKAFNRADVNNYFNSFENKNDDVEDDDDNTEEVEPVDLQHPQQKLQQQKPQMSYEEMVAYNNARLCPKLLLTQRAIQSFIYLLEECRDPHSGKWIEDFLDTPNLINYHGTGAINITRHPTWDAVLYDMMDQMNTQIIVSAKRRGQGGWSKNNPYLQERYVEFEIDIRPASLVQRLLAVRAQLAAEFERDLQIVHMIDGSVVMESYFRKLSSTTTTATGTSGTTSMDNNKAHLFDRVSVDILNNFTESHGVGSILSSSPFRRGNFDLLYSLCTQTAAHRLLRELNQSASSSNINDDLITYQFFKHFYMDNGPAYFDGDQNYGRGDDFIDALLRSSPTLVGSGGRIGMKDPLRVAERLITLRSEIALEWIEMLREVPEDHKVLNDVLVRVMMTRTMEESGNVNDVVNIQEETTLDKLADGTGAFD
jgi:hypothetical protein